MAADVGCLFITATMRYCASNIPVQTWTDRFDGHGANACRCGVYTLQRLEYRPVFLKLYYALARVFSSFPRITHHWLFNLSHTYYGQLAITRDSDRVEYYKI